MRHDYRVLSADELKKIDVSAAAVIDVRTSVEHAGKALTDTHIHIPLDKLDPESLTQSHHLNKDMNIYLLCRSGHRAALAAKKFLDAGYRHVFVIEGGILACEACGHQVATGRVNMISLERQVRIAAGAMVALGAFLAIIFTPYFALIPLLVGCGLLYAGITDRCGMALMLAKASWNQPQSTERT